MKMKYMNIKIVLLFLISLNSYGECINNDNTFCNVKYIKNYDGDSITVDIPNTHPILGKNAKIRLFGLDTPELRTKDKCEKAKGRIAKKLVMKELQKAEYINLLNIKRGKYFRIVASIQYKINGRVKDLTQVLIKNKLGYAYFGKTKKKVNWCLK
jgi:micrococcal nuclease